MADKTDSRDSSPDEEDDLPASDGAAEEGSKAKADASKGAAKAEAKKAEPKKAEAKKAAAAAADDEDDDDEDEDDGEEDDDEEEDDGGDDGEAAGERDESTKGVAKALGIDDDEDAESAEADGEGADKGPAVTNRSARRREEAQRRRAARDKAKKGGKSDDAVDAKEAEPRLPKDKNARAKELLKRRQEASATRGVQLGASELVQDSLARAGSATAKAVRKNLGLILAVLGIGAAAGIGYVVWTGQKEGAIASASDDLIQGVEADRAPTQKEDKRSDEEKKNDPTPFYTSNDVRTDTALAAYKKVADQHPGTGPAILAKLAQGGVQLERGQFDPAIESFGQVVGSQLASADTEVKARATEGIGFAREGKGDLDGALASFKELEAIKGFEDLGKYHQGRLLLKKGQTDKAKETLTELRKKLEVPSLEGPQQDFLNEAVNELLSSIDPTLARRPNSLGGMRGNSMTPEEQAEAQKKAIEAFKRQLEKQQREHPGEAPKLPMPGEDQE